jgi:hypothetical protein
MKSGRFSLSGRIRNRANAHRCPRGPKESVKHGLLPPGIPFGFNHDDRELGWVLAAEDVDLRAYVAFALRPGIGDVFHATAGAGGFVTLDRETPTTHAAAKSATGYAIRCRPDTGRIAEEPTESSWWRQEGTYPVSTLAMRGSATVCVPLGQKSFHPSEPQHRMDRPGSIWGSTSCRDEGPACLLATAAGPQLSAAGTQCRCRTGTSVGRTLASSSATMRRTPRHGLKQCVHTDQPPFSACRLASSTDRRKLRRTTALGYR